MKYGYARVSTAQQKKDGNSLEEQCNHLRREGWWRELPPVGS
ncbi:MAG: hypothetical protein UI647_07870 [Negativibacillus sp.]